MDPCAFHREPLRGRDSGGLVQQRQARGHSQGLAALLNPSPEALLTQTILTQAVSEAEAKKQVDDLMKYLRSLGKLSFETDYTDKNFRFDINWKHR